MHPLANEVSTSLAPAATPDNLESAAIVGAAALEKLITDAQANGNGAGPGETELVSSEFTGPPTEVAAPVETDPPRLSLLRPSAQGRDPRNGCS